MSRAARLRALEERREEQRARMTAFNESRLELIETRISPADYAAIDEEDALSEADPAQHAAICASLPKWPQLPGGAEAWAWLLYVTNELPIWQRRPRPPAGAAAYWAAEIQQVAEYAARTDLTPQQTRAVRWELASLRAAEAHTRYL